MSEKNNFSFLIADDHVLIRRAISGLLSHYFKGCEIATAGDGLELVSKALEKDFDLIMADIRMPNMDGIEAVKKIKGAKPHSKILVITAFDDLALRTTMFNNGVKGFISKSDSEEIIIASVRAVLMGKYFMDGKEVSKPSL